MQKLNEFYWDTLALGNMRIIAMTQCQYLEEKKCA